MTEVTLRLSAELPVSAGAEDDITFTEDIE
jgi:hypothetical protein